MTSATKTHRQSSNRMINSDNDESAKPDLISEEGVSRDITADNHSPVDRRILTQIFTVTYHQFNINQAEIAESCGVSATTISGVVSRGKLVSWDLWQLIIAGLIKYKLTHAYYFWVALPPCIREKIGRNTANSIILAYIAEFKKLTIENEDSIISNVNESLGHLDPTRINDELLSRIRLPGNSSTSNPLSKSTLDSGSDQINSGNGILNFQGGTQTFENPVFFILPDNGNSSNQQILELISNLLKKNADTKEDINPIKKNHNSSN